MIRVVESSSGRRRLQAAAAFVAAHPPSTEVLLIGASRDAVDDLVRDVSRGAGATFGLHRFSFAQWVAVLAAGELARTGRAPASLLGQQAVAARAAFEALGRDEAPRFAPISHFPGFARALASTLDELRLANIDDGTIHAHAPASADLAVLLRRYTEELEAASIADRAEQLRLARAGIAHSRLAALRAAPTVLLDVGLTSVLELDLLRDYFRDTTDLLVTVPTGDRRTLSALEALFGTDAVTREAPEPDDSGLSRLRGYLFSDEPPPAGAAGEQVRFFSAPGEGRECTEIARLALEEARRGVPFDSMAVLVRAPEAYQTLLETALRRAEIPSYFARGTRRPDPSGRAFLALLACRAEGLSAKRFAEYLSFGQVPEPDAAGAPPTDREFWAGPDDDSLGPASEASRDAQAAESARAAATPGKPRQLTLDFDRAPVIEGTLRTPWKWEELLVEAAVIGGLDRWRRRIAGLENELRVRLGGTADELDAPRRRGLERELANLGHLARFAIPVVEALAALPQAAAWGAWLDALTRLAPQVLRDPQRVLALLAELAPMSSVGPVSIDEVRTVLVQRLRSLEAERPAERYGRLFVATPEQVRGRSFRVVFVPGLAERVFPQRPREDPLLLDGLRAALSADLETQEDRGRSERLFLRLAAGAAEERIFLSYPRVDVQQARPRVPSFYGLDVARATRGAVPDYEELERDAATEVDARLAWPAPPDPAKAIDAIEHDLAILGPLLHGESGEDPGGRARYLLELNPHLGRSLRSRWARWRQRKWLPQDGLVRATEYTAPALELNRPGARPYSATALQNFAACPYRFLLSAIHRLEPRKDAVSIENLDPLTRGALFHEVQAATLRRLRESGALPLSAARPGSARDLLDATLTEIAARYRDDLAPAIPRVWEDEIDRVRADLRAWLLRLAAETVWQPAYFEYSFGLPLAGDRDPASRAEPVTLPGGWVLRGAVDLIERDPRNGDLRVTDHKTGADRTHAGLVVGAGETLQPVLYGLAVEAALGKRVASGRLFFCTSKGGFAEHEVPIDERARLYGAEVLQIVDRAVVEGNLPPAPRQGACAWCDFRPVCGPLEELRSALKQREPLADLHELRTLP